MENTEQVVAPIEEVLPEPTELVASTVEPEQAYVEPVPEVIE